MGVLAKEAALTKENVLSGNTESAPQWSWDAIEISLELRILSWPCVRFVWIGRATHHKWIGSGLGGKSANWPQVFWCASGFANEEFKMRELGIRHMCRNCALHNQKGPLNSQSAPESCEIFVFNRPWTGTVFWHASSEKMHKVFHVV